MGWRGLAWNGVGWHRRACAGMGWQSPQQPLHTMHRRVAAPGEQVQEPRHAPRATAGATTHRTGVKPRIAARVPNRPGAGRPPPTGPEGFQRSVDVWQGRAAGASYHYSEPAACVTSQQASWLQRLPETSEPSQHASLVPTGCMEIRMRSVAMVRHQSAVPLPGAQLVSWLAS